MKSVATKKREAGARSLAYKGSVRDLRRQIRALLALPMERRTNFLRVILPGGGSCL